MKFGRVVTFILLFFLMTFIVAQPVVKSSEATTSDKLFLLFENLGFTPQKQLLTNSLSDNFPYNITLAFRTKQDVIAENSITVLVSQEQAGYYLNEFKNLFSYLQDNTEQSLPINFVFTANDENITDSLSGTKTYAESIQKKNTNFILCLDATNEKNSHTLAITPGGRTVSGKGIICSSSVMKTVLETCYDLNIPFSIQGFFLPLYRLGFINTSTRLSYMLQEGFPAISIALNKASISNLFVFLKSFSNYAINWNNSKTDIHYSVFKLPRHALFLSENIYIILLIISAAITLFLLFGLTFMQGPHSHIHRKEFSKTWPIIPVGIIITTTFLILTQNITQLILPTTLNPMIVLCIKITLTLLFAILFSFIQHLFKFPMTGFIYGFLLTIVSFLNIFIFAIIDLPLTLLFVLEYCIIYTTRKIRNVIAISSITIFIILLFIPFLITISRFNDVYTQQLISNTPFFINFIFAWLIVPLEIMLIRIAVRSKAWGRHPSITKQKIIIRIIITIVSIIVIILGSTIITHIISLPNKNKLEKNSDIPNLLILKPSQTYLFDRSFAQLQISSRIPILHYKIIIESLNPLPILEANYPYDMLNAPGIAIFNFDEYPPNPLTLSFTYNSNYEVICKVTAYYMYENSLLSKNAEYVFSKQSKEEEAP